MSGRYLTELADVTRSAGLVTTECDGWQSRSRSSGGYSSGRPTHVMVHHTASGPASDGWPDVNYMIYSSDARPTANLYLGRSGEVWIMAAGATNTNGSGGPLDNVPADSMNTYAIGIEAGNDGVGEPWPASQQDAYLALVDALCGFYAIPAGHVRSHFEWAPTRKVDPAGPSRWSNPSGGGSGNMWRMDDFRAASTEGDEMTAEESRMLHQIYAAVFAATPGELPRQVWAAKIDDLPTGEGSAADMMRDQKPGEVARFVWAEKIDDLPTEEGSAAAMMRDIHGAR